MRHGLGVKILAGLLAASASGAIAADAPTKAELDAKNGAIVLDHYPPDSLKAGEEGVVHFRVTLDRDSSLDSCVVTQSSGFPRLDNATCDMLVTTARIKRAADADGPNRRITDGSVVWKLPEGMVKAVPATPAPATAAKAEELADAKLICRRATKTGSLRVSTKVCLTKEDWDRARENAQRETKDMQTPKGPFGY